MLNINPTTFFILTILIAFINSALTALAAIIVVRLNRKYDERRHLRELLFKVALDHWKQNCEIALHQQNVRNVWIYPFDDTLLHFVKLMQIMESDLTPQNVEAKLKQLNEFSDKIRLYRESTE